MHESNHAALLLDSCPLYPHRAFPTAQSWNPWCPCAENKGMKISWITSCTAPHAQATCSATGYCNTQPPLVTESIQHHFKWSYAAVWDEPWLKTKGFSIEQCDLYWTVNVQLGLPSKVQIEEWALHNKKDLSSLWLLTLRSQSAEALWIFSDQYGHPRSRRYSRSPGTRQTQQCANNMKGWTCTIRAMFQLIYCFHQTR